MKLTVTILIFLLMSARTFAQSDKDINFYDKGHKSGKIIQGDLALTDKQSKQLQSIREMFYTRAQKILHNNSLSAQQKQDQLSQLQQERESSIQAVLSKEQYLKYKQWDAKRRERWRRLEKAEERQLPGKTAPGKS
jgi:Spy/CpxP family protein refolding chaperone